GSSALSGVINIRTAYPKNKPLTKVNLYTGFRSAILEDDANVGKRIANFFGMDASKANGKKWWDGVANFSGVNFLHSRKIKQLDVVIGGNFHYDHGYLGPHPKFETIQALSDLPSTQFQSLWGAGYIDKVTGDTVADIANDQVREIRGRFNFNLRYRNKKITGLAYGLNGNFMRSSKNFSLIWNNKGVSDPNGIGILPGVTDTASYLNQLYIGDDGLYRAYPGTMTLTEITTFYFDPFVTYVTSRGIQHSLRSRVLYSNNQNSNDQSNKSTMFFGEYQLQRTFSKLYNLSMAAGASGSYTMSESEVFVGGDTSGSNNAKNFSLFMQLDKKFWKVLNLSVGVRGEYYQINDQEFAVKPVFRSGVSFKMGRETYVRYSYGQGYRFPTIAEKFIQTTSGGFGVFPNPDLKPETSWNMEIGFKQGFKLGKFYGYLDFVGFWQHFNNSIEFVMTQSDQIPGLKFFNTGDNRVRGLEASVMGSGQFTKSFGINVIAGYTFTVPEAINPDEPYHIEEEIEIHLGDTVVIRRELTHYGTSVDSTKILKYRFQHLASLDIEFKYRKWALGYSFRYYSKVENLDKVLYDLDASDMFNTGIIQWRGDEDYANADPNGNDYILNNKNGGNYVMDARLSFQVAEWLKAAFIVNNFM
ncbi:MAG: TonB-dependent receptor, partial [Flavobacteriales bacterium]|nr:TonB-dependent receptor [Flavobacteriales bacterium]